LVTEVAFGISAYATCAILTGAGFSFSWHEDQPPGHRDDIWTTNHPDDPEAELTALPERA